MKSNTQITISIYYQIMDEESPSMQFESFQAHHHTHSNQQPLIATQLFSDQQLSKDEAERSTPRSLQHANKKQSDYRNFGKHYTRTIKNIIKSHVNVWPLDQITQSIAKQIVKVIQRIYHPPKKMIEAIFCRETNLEKFRKIGYGSLLDNFRREDIISSCSSIKHLVMAYVSREDAELMIGKRIGNAKLFTEYVKKVTREYKHSNRFSYRLRPNISRQIRQQAMRTQLQNDDDQRELVLDQDERLEKFAQQESNFLDCL